MVSDVKACSVSGEEFPQSRSPVLWLLRGLIHPCAKDTRNAPGRDSAWGFGGEILKKKFLSGLMFSFQSCQFIRGSKIFPVSILSFQSASVKRRKTSSTSPNSP